jgi:hypothetical protein
VASKEEVTFVASEEKYEFWGWKRAKIIKVGDPEAEDEDKVSER